MPNLNHYEYAPFFQPYISALNDNDKSLFEYLEESKAQFDQTLGKISPEKSLFQYAENKWTIKEIVQHLIDAERVFNYRALRFARCDSTDLFGFDENYFVDHSNANQREMNSLVKEFNSLRETTILMYKGFTEEALLRKGKSGGNEISVRALGYITSGHLIHHLRVIKNRYLPDL
jgi:hypothetical protein